MTTAHADTLEKRPSHPSLTHATFLWRCTSRSFQRWHFCPALKVTLYAESLSVSLVQRQGRTRRTEGSNEPVNSKDKAHVEQKKFQNIRENFLPPQHRNVAVEVFSSVEDKSQDVTQHVAGKGFVPNSVIQIEMQPLLK